MRKLKGVITSLKMQKTAVVRVDRLKKHPKYGKYYRATKKFKAHLDENSYQLGDLVLIQEIRPLSKDKKWKVAALVKRVESEVRMGDTADESPRSKEERQDEK